MKNRILLALFPVALFSMAAKDSGCASSEEPIVPVDAGSDATTVGDCAIPETPCPSGTTFSVANCTCVTTTPADAGATDASTGFSDCPIPEPACPPGTGYSVAQCACVATADASTGFSDCPIPEPACPPGTGYSVAQCACVAIPDASTSSACADLASSAKSAITAAEAQAESNLSCTQDSDCVAANNAISCVDGCGVILTQAAAAQFASTLAQINATTCATYTADGCPPVEAIPCAAFMAFCKNNVCSSTP